MTNPSDAQKSEVHDTTADASTSPTAAGDRQTTQRVANAPETPHDHRNIPAPSPGTTINDDAAEDGGPIVITSDDPDLNPPRVPSDPFPTDGTPEIDPKVE